MAEANRVLEEFLPGFNARFGVAPREAEAAYRPLTEGVELKCIFSFRHASWIARDNTVTYQSRTPTVLPEPGESRSTRTKVEVRQRLDGSLAVYHQGQMLRIQEAPPRASCGHRVCPLKPPQLTASANKRPPPPGTPWIRLQPTTSPETVIPNCLPGDAVVKVQLTESKLVGMPYRQPRNKECLYARWHRFWASAGTRCDGICWVMDHHRFSAQPRIPQPMVAN